MHKFRLEGLFVDLFSKAEQTEAAVELYNLLLLLLIETFATRSINYSLAVKSLKVMQIIFISTGSFYLNFNYKTMMSEAVIAHDWRSFSLCLSWLTHLLIY